MPLALESDLLQRIKALNDAASQGVRTLVSDATLTALAREYEANLKKRHVDIGFNLFAIVSDLYYRENFHSDILQAVLDPAGQHQEKEKYLHLFLNFLRQHGAAVVLSDYSDSQVVREEGRIDILIRDKTSRKAVIIENKINSAPDMPRQLPRYLDIVTAQGYTCDAIIYLRLTGHTGPDMTNWSPTDRQNVEALLKIIPAYAETKTDLLTGWIAPCQESSLSQDARHIFRQYGDLLKKLGGNIMNKPVMDTFYNLIVQGENLNSALSLKAMLDDLILYRVEKLIAHFQYDLAPFSRIANNNVDSAYFEGLYRKDAHFGIDISVIPQCYRLHFWDKEDRAGERGEAKAILQRMGRLAEFESVFDGGVFIKPFVFPSQEQHLIDFVTAFKRDLAAATLPVLG